MPILPLLCYNSKVHGGRWIFCGKPVRVLLNACHPDPAARPLCALLRAAKNFDERPVTSLRKILFVLLAILLCAVCTAALADTVYSMSPAPVQVTLRDDRTVVTSDNLGEHPELLTVIGMSRDDTLADWAARGVVLQAWSPIRQKYTCLEISVVQDAAAAQYHDLMHNPSDKAAWAEYIGSYKNNETWTSLGYTFQFLDKEQYHAEGNYYLLLKYKRSYAGQDYRGYMARTVYQGYTLVFDLKCYNQLPTDSSTNELYRVIKTVTDSGAEGQPAVSGEAGSSAGSAEGSAEGAGASAGTGAVSPTLTVTAGAPREINTNSFTVEGTTLPGAQVIGVMMKSVGDPMPQRFETIAHSKTGAFKMKVTIPENEESVWLMTLNVYETPESNEIVAEKVFDTTTYKKTLIPFELDGPVPEQCYSEELVISGTAMKACDVQCIATNSAGKTIFDKKSHPNATARFTFKIPLKDEDSYEIALVATKKGYDTKRFVYNVSRFLSDEAKEQQIRKSATRVGYGALTSRIDQYVGKTMTFSVWITAIDQLGDEWIISAAGAKTGDHYSQPMIFVVEQEPSFAVEEKHTLYGKCKGFYQIQSEEGTESIPSFDLLLSD